MYAYSPLKQLVEACLKFLARCWDKCVEYWENTVWSHESNIELFGCHDTPCLEVKWHTTQKHQQCVWRWEHHGVGCLSAYGTDRLYIIERWIENCTKSVSKNLLPSTRVMRMKQGGTFQQDWNHRLISSISKYSKQDRHQCVGDLSELWHLWGWTVHHHREQSSADTFCASTPDPSAVIPSSHTILWPFMWLHCTGISNKTKYDSWKMSSQKCCLLSSKHQWFVAPPSLLWDKANICTTLSGLFFTCQCTWRHREVTEADREQGQENEKGTGAQSVCFHVEQTARHCASFLHHEGDPDSSKISRVNNTTPFTSHHDAQILSWDLFLASSFPSFPYLLFVILSFHSFSLPFFITFSLISSTLFLLLPSFLLICFPLFYVPLLVFISYILTLGPFEFSRKNLHVRDWRKTGVGPIADKN